MNLSRDTSSDTSVNPGVAGFWMSMSILVLYDTEYQCRPRKGNDIGIGSEIPPTLGIFKCPGGILGRWKGW